MLLFAFVENKVHGDNSCFFSLARMLKLKFLHSKKRKSNIVLFSSMPYINDLKILDSDISFLVLTIHLHLNDLLLV